MGETIEKSRINSLLREEERNEHARITCRNGKNSGKPPPQRLFLHTRNSAVGVPGAESSGREHPHLAGRSLLRPVPQTDRGNLCAYYP